MISVVQSKVCHCQRIAVTYCTDCGQSLCDPHRSFRGKALLPNGHMRLVSTCEGGCASSAFNASVHKAIAAGRAKLVRDGFNQVGVVTT